MTDNVVSKRFNTSQRLGRRWGVVMVALGLMFTLFATTAPTSLAWADETGEHPVPNHSFEAPVGPDGEIEGWSPLWAAEVSVTDARATDGTHSLRFVDADTDFGGAVVSDPIPVSAGPYELQLDLYFESGTMNSMLYLLDSDGERIGNDWIRWDDSPGAWTPQRWQMDITDEVAQVQIVMNTASTMTSEVYVDNVRFAPVVSSGEEESLGSPMTELSSAGVGYTYDADGRALGLVVANGRPPVASVVDINTGELVATKEIPNLGAAWAHVTAEDRSVYFSGQGSQIWRFDPDDLSFTELAVNPLGETFIWAADVSESGRIVWSTYPGGKVISYDPQTDQWHDHGTVQDGNKYGRSLSVVGEVAYVGQGSTAAIAAVDLTTDEITTIANPESETDQEMVYDLDARAGLLFARYSPSNKVHVYDLAAGEWIDTISEDGWGLGVSQPFETTIDGTVRQEVMVIVSGGRGLAYDLATGDERETCLEIGGGGRKWSNLALPIDGMSDQVQVTARADGTFHAYDPSSDSCSAQATDAVGAAVPVRVLGTGPDGDIYMGGKSFVHLDPASDEMTKLPLTSQIQGFGNFDDLLVFGTYTAAGINVYDTSQPLEPGVNPRPRLYVGHEQDRPIAMTRAGDRLAIGTFPTPARLGGALALLDPDTMELEVHDNIIENQSIYALAYRDGLLYGGSGITGGLGVDPTETEGKLFVFDPETGEVVFSTVPVPGDGHVSGLTFDDQGNLWGVTGNSLFKFDPTTREVVAQQRYFNTDDSRSYVRGRDLQWHNGRLVGSTSGNVFEVDPQTWEMNVIATGTANFAIDPQGRYYYGRGAELLRWTPADARPACDRTLSQDHRGPLDVEGETVCATDIAITGPVTVTDGGSLVLVDSQLRGALRADDAATVEAVGSTLDGPVMINGTTNRLRLVDNTVSGPVRLDGNLATAIAFTGNSIAGPLMCRDNPAEIGTQAPRNEFTGPRHGQCAP